MEVGFKSDKGVLRSNNEDACFVLLPDKTAGVADGVGGGNSGEIASRTAVNEIANYIKSHPVSGMQSRDQIVGYFQVCLEYANRKVFNLANAYPENTGMATTLALVYIRSGKAYIANVGDSRVYAYRNGILKQLTDDHTYVNTLVKAGIMTKEQADRDERRNEITRAIGAEANVIPDYFQVEIKKNDIFILCTDGLYDEVGQEEMIRVTESAENMSELCSELITRANLNGGHDNITVVSIKVTEDDLIEY